MGWLDRYVFGVAVQSAGSLLPQRAAINFVSGATVADDSSNNRTNVTIDVTGARRAIDANTKHAFYCNDTSGTGLADYGTEPTNTMILAGSAYTSYYLGANRPFSRGTKGLHLLADIAARGAQSNVTSMASGPFTLEAFVVLSEQLSYDSLVNMIVAIDDGTANNVLQLGIVNGPYVFAGMIRGGTDKNTTVPYATTNKTVQFGVPMHIACVWDNTATPKLKVYLNGVLAGDNNEPTDNWAVSLTRATIGNRGALDNAFRGWIGEVRISNIARSQAQMLTNAEICFAL